jgi:hypothetical protein
MPSDPQTPTDVYYHASLEDFGLQMEFNQGGYYEKTDENGVPQQNRIGGEYIGWKHSNTEQFCASKTPEAAVFAKVQNLTNETGGHGGDQPTPITVYELTKEPDVDLSNTVIGDFSVIEEVRYDNPDENPIKGTKLKTVMIPPLARGDISLAYLPDGPYLIEHWATEVKSALKELIDTGEYPSHNGELNGCEQPDIEAYQQYQSQVSG